MAKCLKCFLHNQFFLFRGNNTRSTYLVAWSILFILSKCRYFKILSSKLHMSNLAGNLKVYGTLSPSTNIKRYSIIYACIQICTHIQTHNYTCVFINTYTPIYTWIYIYTNIHSFKCTSMTKLVALVIIFGCLKLLLVNIVGYLMDFGKCIVKYSWV